MQNIYGQCSDDVIALNILNIPANVAGSYNTYYAIGDTSNSLRDSVSNVYINNVTASSYSNIVRCLLPSNNVMSKNVTIRNIENTLSPKDVYFNIAGTETSCVSIGSTNATYGGANVVGQFSKFFISNVKSDYTKYGVNIVTTLINSSISDVIKNYPTYITTSPVTYTDQNKIKNVINRIIISYKGFLGRILQISNRLSYY